MICAPTAMWLIEPKVQKPRLAIGNEIQDFAYAMTDFFGRSSGAPRLHKMVKASLKLRSLHSLFDQCFIDDVRVANSTFQMLVATVQPDPVSAVSQQICKKRSSRTSGLGKACCRDSHRRTSREDRRSGWRTLRRGRVGAMKQHPLSRKRIQVRC